jgi:hypothetical protein
MRRELLIITATIDDELGIPDIQKLDFKLTKTCRRCMQNYSPNVLQFRQFLDLLANACHRHEEPFDWRAPKERIRVPGVKGSHKT